MRTMIVLSAAAITLSNVPAAFAEPAANVAPTTTTPASQTAKAKSATKERIICETEQVLGSLLPRRLCMTESQWSAARDGARRAVRDQAQDVEPRLQSGGH